MYSFSVQDFFLHWSSDLLTQNDCPTLQIFWEPLFEIAILVPKLSPKGLISSKSIYLCFFLFDFTGKWSNSWLTNKMTTWSSGAAPTCQHLKVKLIGMVICVERKRWKECNWKCRQKEWPRAAVLIELHFKTLPLVVVWVL